MLYCIQKVRVENHGFNAIDVHYGQMKLVPQKIIQLSMYATTVSQMIKFN